MANFEYPNTSQARVYGATEAPRATPQPVRGRARGNSRPPPRARSSKRSKRARASPRDLAAVKTTVEEAIRALKLSEAAIQASVIEVPESEFEVEGVNNMPAYLERFLAESSSQAGFSYEVIQDEVRGWVVCWKEYTHRGTVRGYGQFYERPYAWLEE